MTSPRLDRGSFRDREGRVFYRDGRVYRALSRHAYENWRAVSATDFFPRLIEEGKVVGTREAGLAKDDLRQLSAHWVEALEHDRIPWISYPYEWPFGMLRDAALLQLELLTAALSENMVLKDASAYNLQWEGPKPVFIDIASFEPWTEGDPWVGYLQFCQLFLYPLLLTAYKDLPFQPWLRGSIDGITPHDCDRILGLRNRFRPGGFVDVYLQAKLQAGNAGSEGSLRSDIRKIGLKKEMIIRNVERLKKVVSKLRWRRAASEWSAYAATNTYDEENHEIKLRFVRRVARGGRWPLAWDLGCNTGVFSRLLAESADYVVAVDGDHLAVEHLYESLKKDGPGNILPLVSSLADPSPALGWRHQERQALAQRPRPSLILCLALIHHMVITANIPMTEWIGWLASLGGHLVIEFVSKNDPMVRKLLRNKEDIYHDYEPEVFEENLRRHFMVLEMESYHEGTRTLYFARPRK